MKMTSLRRSAKGQQCQIRIMNVCNYDSETVVLCHYRMSGDGMGRKPPDTRAAYACHDCHAEVDGRTSNSGLSKSELKLAFAEGVFRSQDIFLEKGLVEVK